MKTYSISIRLLRVTHEEAFIRVLVSEDLLEPRPDGFYGLNIEKLMARAVELGLDPDVEWSLEGEPEITPHPIQKPPPGVEG